jgi:hypothetical protein
MSLKKLSTALATLPVMFLLGGCSESQPDYTPFGDGMKAIGISLVVYGVVQVLGSLVQAGENKPKDPPPKPRRPRDSNRREGGE